MKVPFPPDALLYAAGGLLGVCVAALGAGAGFLLDAWWGVGAGLIVGVGVFLLIMRTAFLLCSLQMRETLCSLTKGDAQRGKRPRSWSCTRSPFMRRRCSRCGLGGVSPVERDFRRFVAYRLVAREE
ncbi:hypothetical protein, partial [Streptomyces kaempferi]